MGLDNVAVQWPRTGRFYEPVAPAEFVDFARLAEKVPRTAAPAAALADHIAETGTVRATGYSGLIDLVLGLNGVPYAIEAEAPGEDPVIGPGGGARPGQRRGEVADLLVDPGRLEAGAVQLGPGGVAFGFRGTQPHRQRLGPALGRLPCALLLVQPLSGPGDLFPQRADHRGQPVVVPARPAARARPRPKRRPPRGPPRSAVPPPPVTGSRATPR